MKLVKSKVLKVRERKYITDGKVESLLNVFEVPKGPDDIRMVYDATKSGLNESVWAPNFFLPTITSVEGTLDPTTWISDADF